VRFLQAEAADPSPRTHRPAPRDRERNSGAPIAVAHLVHTYDRGPRRPRRWSTWLLLSPRSKSLGRVDAAAPSSRSGTAAGASRPRAPTTAWTSGIVPEQSCPGGRIRRRRLLLRAEAAVRREASSRHVVVVLTGRLPKPGVLSPLAVRAAMSLVWLDRLDRRAAVVVG
jgi:hypothetical protein